MYRLLTAIFLFSSISAAAQKESYLALVKLYYIKLDSVDQLLAYRKADTIHNLLKKANSLYVQATALDTATAKPVLLENVSTLAAFLKLLKTDTASEATVDNAINFFLGNAAWYQDQYAYIGLDNCPSCFLI